MSALGLLRKCKCKKRQSEAAFFPKGNITVNTEIPLEDLFKKIISNCPKRNHVISSISEEKLNYLQGNVKNI